MILWNYELDKKVKIHTHKSRIVNFLFCGKGLHYIVSIDSSINPTLILSEWTSFSKLCEKKMGKKAHETNHAFGLYIERKRQIVFFENLINCSYSRIIVSELRNENLAVSLIENLHDLGTCLSVHYFDYNMSVTLVTVEKFCIKFWKFNGEKINLENRIHSKEEISEAFLSLERNLLYFVTSRNVLNVLNQAVLIK